MPPPPGGAFLFGRHFFYEARTDHCRYAAMVPGAGPGCCLYGGEEKRQFQS